VASTHGTKSILTEAIARIAPESDASLIADVVMDVLHRQRILTVREDSAPALLTALGRLIADLAVHPASTIREVTMRLGITERNTTNLMTRLVGSGMGVRTRVGDRNRYSIDHKSVLDHRDSAAILKALLALAEASAPEQGDSTPESWQ